MTKDSYKKLKKINDKDLSFMKFIAGLIKRGVPLSAINVNNWVAIPNTYIYIDIPYGSKKNAGKSKKWKNRFGVTTLKSAMKFWNSRK